MEKTLILFRKGTYIKHWIDLSKIMYILVRLIDNEEYVYIRTIEDENQYAIYDNDYILDTFDKIEKWNQFGLELIEKDDIDFNDCAKLRFYFVKDNLK